MRKVNFHLNHGKIPKDNTIQVRVAPEATTLRSGKVIEKHILGSSEKDDELIYEGKKMVEPEHCKEKTNSSQHFHLS